MRIQSSFIRISEKYGHKRLRIPCIDNVTDLDAVGVPGGVILVFKSQHRNVLADAVYGEREYVFIIEPVVRKSDEDYEDFVNFHRDEGLQFIATCVMPRDDFEYPVQIVHVFTTGDVEKKREFVVSKRKPLVFVDPLFDYGWRLGPSCHLYCELTPEGLKALHRVARAIGMKRIWFQDKPFFPHYDLVASKRARAVKLPDVKETTLREMAEEVRYRRERARGPQEGRRAVFRGRVGVDRGSAENGPQKRRQRPLRGQQVRFRVRE